MTPKPIATNSFALSRPHFAHSSSRHWWKTSIGASLQLNTIAPTVEGGARRPVGTKTPFEPKGKAEGKIERAVYPFPSSPLLDHIWIYKEFASLLQPFTKERTDIVGLGKAAPQRIRRRILLYKTTHNFVYSNFYTY
jgi:hypothetical protein